MHRITLLTALMGTRIQRAFSARLETNASGSWVVDTNNTSTVIVRWSIYEKAASELPSAGTDSTLLHPESTALVCPDVIDINLTGVTTLTLRRCAVVAIVNRSTGQVVTPTSIAITDTATTITLPVLTGGHRLFLAEPTTITCDPAEFVDNALVLPQTCGVFHSVVNGVATKPWASLTYADGKTYVTFASGYATSSELLIAPAMLMPVKYGSNAVALRLPCEYPTLILSSLGLASTPSQIINNGCTYVPVNDIISPLTFVVASWVYRTINPNIATSDKDTITRFIEVDTVTNDNLVEAVRMMHSHANLSSLAKIVVNDGVLLIDGIAVNPAELQSTMETLIALLDNFTIPAHSHSLSQVDTLVDALQEKSDTGHGHSIGDIVALATVLSGYAVSGHGHSISDIASLTTTLAALSAALNTHSHPQTQVTSLVTDLGNKLNGTAVTSLPSTPVVNRLYMLTDDDHTAKAARGLYLWTGTAWVCVIQNYAYELGSISGSVTLPSISNVVYTATIADDTSFVFPRRINPGNIVLRLTDGGSHLVSWPSNVVWAEDAMPVLSASTTDWLIFASADGYEWHGSLQIRSVTMTAREMVSTWVTATTNVEAVLPFVAAGTYNCIVDWGDGTVTTVRSYDDDGVRHTYAAAGTYTVRITGLATHWSFNNAGSKDLITAVTNLGDLGWTSLNGAFYGCTNLTAVAGGVTEQVTDFTNCFRAATSVVPDISTWDMSAALTISGMFYGAVSANPDISGITMPVVTNVTNAFRGMIAFNRTVSAAMFWTRDPAIADYLNCFTDSTNIANYADIPAGWKGL